MQIGVLKKIHLAGAVRILRCLHPVLRIIGHGKGLAHHLSGYASLFSPVSLVKGLTLSLISLFSPEDEQTKKNHKCDQQRVNSYEGWNFAGARK